MVITATVADTPADPVAEPPADPPVTITGRLLIWLAVNASMEATACIKSGLALSCSFRYSVDRQVDWDQPGTERIIQHRADK
jgi:hypothetical protein